MFWNEPHARPHAESEVLEDKIDRSSIIEDVQAFGQRTQINTDYLQEDKTDNIPKKRIRIRVPVIRSRSAREHARTVVRRRPHSTSPSFEPIEIIPTPTSRRVITRTRVRNVESIEVSNNVGNDVSDNFHGTTHRHKVTITRRRKISPTTTIPTYNRERVTRKKLVTVRPIPEPTSTLAIITTGFYTAPSFEEDEYNDDIDSKLSTPNLSTYAYDQKNSNELSSEEKKMVSNIDRPSSFNDPIIITDNFFYPMFHEESTTNSNENDYEDETKSTMVDFEDVTTASVTEKQNIEDEISNTEKAVESYDVTIPIFETTDAIPTIVNHDVHVLESHGSNQNTTEKSNLNFTPSTTNDPNKSVQYDADDDLRVIPIPAPNEDTYVAKNDNSASNINLENNDIPSVIPLETQLSMNKLTSEIETKATPTSNLLITTSIPSLTPEDIEAGLADDLYLSLSRPDFPQIAPSKVESSKNLLSTADLNQATPELETSVYYTETVVTSTRLRTYTYVVTKLNGLETEVTSSTTVRPRVTTLTLTVPVTVTVTPTEISSSVTLNSSLERTKSIEEVEDEGRRFNLATRVMSNGVEVIVAGTTPAYRWENSNPQPTLTLSEAVVMLLPQDKPNEFVTKTCTTTFTYLNTITRDGTTIVSTDQQVIANTATEERHRKPASEAASVTLEASPTLQTEIFKTTYTYLLLNTDHPDEKDALESSTRVISNTVTAPQYYLDMVLEPSETQKPETHTYYSTRVLEKTFVEDGKTKIEMTNDVVTQLIITESAPPAPKSASIETTLTALEESANSLTDIAKTHYITYTYYNTFLEKDSTVVKTNIATSSDIIYEKVPAKKTSTKSISVSATPDPIQIFATKTYLTTFTYFTTLLTAIAEDETSTIITSRTQIVENVVTESIAPSLLDAGYMNALLTSSHNSDSLKNVVTGSTIIFFDDEEQIAPTSTTKFESSSTIDKLDNSENTSTSSISDSVGSETNEATSRPIEPDASYNEEEAVDESTEPPSNKKPSQVSNLLSLGSLGINSLSALGPVITAMAGLLQGKTSATRRNDTEPVTEPPVTTTQRAPIYIPVGEFADGDIETAESQNIASHLAHNNHITETRHKVTSSLADGIPISPGEIITANSDVIIGKPGKMGPRPPPTLLQNENIGMKPPPMPVPNIPVHPVLEVAENEPSKKVVKFQKGNQQLEILPAHQIYEEHIQGPIIYNQPTSKLYSIPQQSFVYPPQKKISSKQDILENDPLLIPPSFVSNSHSEIKNRNFDKNRRPPWSPKDPITIPNDTFQEKNQLKYGQKEYIHSENSGTIDGSKTKVRVPEPIVHQVPHVIDRSTGQPLLVNIQPSQVANVVIPQGGTQALIFGDTSEPHISGQYFDDPSPYPEPEVGPGFVGIDKVENLPQFSKNDNPADYMTPPSPPTAIKSSPNPALGNRKHIPLSQASDFKQQSNPISRPEKIPIRHNLNLSTGQGHVHSEILVHQGSENDNIRYQSRPATPIRNYQNTLYTRREQIPPRRTEIPMPTENTYYDTVNTPPFNPNWKNEKKPIRISPSRRPRPTIRHRVPTRVTGRPFERPAGPIRQPSIQHNQRLPLNNYYQNELNKYVTQSTPLPFSEINEQIYSAADRNQGEISQNVHNSYQNNYGQSNYQNIKNQTQLENEDYVNEDYISNSEIEYKNPTDDNENYSGSKYGDKTVDSEVEGSENVKITSNPQDKDEKHDSSYAVMTSLQSSPNQSKIIENKDGDIIFGSEKKQDHYLSESYNNNREYVHNNPNVYMNNRNPEYEMSSTPSHEIVDLQPPAIIPVFELNGHSRPFSKPNVDSPIPDSKLEIITKSPDQNNNVVQGHMQQGIGQVLQVETDKSQTDHSKHRRPQSHYSTRIRPNHPQIITKPKLQVPKPVIITSGKPPKRPSVQFSLPIDSIGEENDSKTQTERPPSVSTSGNKKTKEESLDTAYQTNFASTDTTGEKDDKKITTSQVDTISQVMTPPPVTSPADKQVKEKKPMEDEGLKPPPPPTDVLGLSPPPVDIITTKRPLENKQNHVKISHDVSGLKPPPLYIPLKEATVTLPLPSTSMVPPSPRPTVVRPYIAEILSQDMIPPKVDTTTTRPLEIATVRPGVAVSGSIQIATAVATSHIPVVQDLESKIPIVHGTVDLPVVVDVPEEFLKPLDTKKPDHVSVYTVRPFETRQRNTIRPTMTTTSSSTLQTVDQSQAENEPHNYYNHQVFAPTRLSTSHEFKKPSKLPEISIMLEPSTDIHLPSFKIEATESLSTNSIGNKRIKLRPTAIEKITTTRTGGLQSSKKVEKTTQSHEMRKTDLKIKESASKMMEIIGTVVHEFIQNSTNERVEMKPQEVTRYETLTVTRTETSVVGSPPTTRTLLITHTLTSTRVETVTETLLRPTSVISTITSTILQSVTHVPNYDNTNDNESIFVVMSDHKTPAPGAEEVEAEYGEEEDVSRDEEDISGNEIHRVLSGGILGAPSVPIQPPKVQCVPECKASKSEVCAEANGEMRCICRPGFARMFPDRPCKPTYTFTVGIGLERLGREQFKYTPDMNDTNSHTFKRYLRPVTEALDRTLMQSDLRDVYRGLYVDKFLPYPPKVLFNVQLTSNTNESRLKEVIRKYLVMSNYSLGGTDVYALKDLGIIHASDFDECATEDGGPHHDCSPNAVCINTIGTYQCSCKEGFADLSENSGYPGRFCSQGPLGCNNCMHKGHCVRNNNNQEVCDCFAWYIGSKCQYNLKVWLIGCGVTVIGLVFILLIVFAMNCCKSANRRRRSADRRAMISGNAGDTSSEGSIAELAIPHHVPHILPPPPQMVAPAPPMKKSVRKISVKPRRAPRKPAPVIPVPMNATCVQSEQRDRSLTVMIPRAKYRSTPQSATPQNYKPMSTFAVDEHKLIDYLEGGIHPGNRKPSLVSMSDYKESDHRLSKQHANFAPSGALVSAGFQVSATVTRPMDAESTLARSCGETTVEPSTKIIRSTEHLSQELEATMARSCAETTIQASTKLLRLDLVDAGSTLARSCGETTIQPPTKIADRKDCNRDARDSASEGHTMAERDLGSTLRLPAQHATLYNQDRTSSDRESNFDSL